MDFSFSRKVSKKRRTIEYNKTKRSLLNVNKNFTQFILLKLDELNIEGTS